MIRTRQIDAFKEDTKYLKLLNRIEALENELAFSRQESINYIPVYRALTYKDLIRMQPPAPAFGYIEFVEDVQSNVVFDEQENITGYQDYPVFKPAARYFVRAYPPMPRMDYLEMPTQDGRTVQWSTKIYQPSAGISGAVVYFDQDIKVEDTSFSRDAELSYPPGSAEQGKRGIYKMADVTTRINDRNEEVIDSIRIDYANGLDTTKLAWLEIDILPPWGKKDKTLPQNSAGEVTWAAPVYVPPEI